MTKRVGLTGTQVAAQFAAQAVGQGGSARSSGSGYFLNGVKIAVWVNSTHINVNWGGYPNKVTQRHLKMIADALGLNTVGVTQFSVGWALLHPSTIFQVILS